MMRWKLLHSVLLWICFVTATCARSIADPVEGPPVIAVRLQDGIWTDNGDGNVPQGNYMDQYQMGAGYPQFLVPQDQGLENLVREPRAAAYHLRGGNNYNQVKHVNRIPAVRSNNGPHHGTSPPPDQSDEDDFETLEANREAFMEILNDHAKHPHRKRSLKHHNERFRLSYDFEKKRYSLTEQQSDEF